MSVTLAAKLKLITTAEQAEHLRRTALAYRDALNYTSRAAYDRGKVSNSWAKYHQVSHPLTYAR